MRRAPRRVDGLGSAQATTRKDKALGALSTREVDDGADFYLDRLREVYERLADPASGRLTRASWEAACRTSKSDDSPSPAWGSAAWDADDRDVAQVLFEAADLADDEVCGGVLNHQRCATPSTRLSLCAIDATLTLRHRRS